MRFLPVLFILAAACTTPRYFIVRHAEKAILTKDSASMMANDPPLSEAGKLRAVVLRDELAHKHVKHIYSTSTLRTISTTEPLSQAGNTRIEIYRNVDSLISVLKTIRGNALIVGHSNTVDDIVNKLCGRTEVTGDLKDKEYDHLFVVKRRNRKLIFEKGKYGNSSNLE